MLNLSVLQESERANDYRWEFTFQCCFALLRSCLTFEAINEGISIDAVHIIVETWTIVQQFSNDDIQGVVKKTVRECIDELKLCDMFDQITLIE
jgi:hypothetical protein